MAGKPVARIRKRKVLARLQAQNNAQQDATADTNAAELLPAHRREVEERKAQMKAELKQTGVKVSSKKAKRLEKYIENKLKKDENKALLAKLAAAKIDTSLFSSTRSLGQGKETKRQAMSRALREEQAGLDLGDRAELLYEERRDPDAEPDPEDSEGLGDEDLRGDVDRAVAALNAVKDADAKAAAAPSASVGAGLKRPLEVDDRGQPVIRKRQKRGGVKSKVSFREGQHVGEAEMEEEWNGFSDGGVAELSANSLDDSDEEASSEEEDTERNSEEVSDEASEDSEGTDDSEGDSDDDSEMDDAGSDEEAQRKARSSAFKAWAQQRRNEALGYQMVTSEPMQLDAPKPANFTPRPMEQDPLPAELQPSTNTRRKAFAVSVSRTAEIQEARLKLPVVAEEQKIMEAIHNHDTVVICGSTGSGKTTQVPQFLFEAGYGSPESPTPGMIGVTQPRRVAAVSMSRRVAEELGSHADVVAYQIRFEGTVDPKTAIKFMTDGVLLREVAQDFALRKYSAIVIDEAHERSVNTDILIGMLSRVIKLRSDLAKEDPGVKPLKLVIMSATLRIEDMTQNSNLFQVPPPVVEVEGRQHPVTIHFARRTEHDYVKAVFKKVSKAHRKLPPGDMLVFLTGQNEILHLQRLLKARFQGLQQVDRPKVQISGSDAVVEAEDVEFGDFNEEVDDDVDIFGSEDEADQDDEAEFEIEDEEGAPQMKLQILPLYSLLPTREQLRIFEPAPSGTRRVVLGTNVAETSLTIPGIRYVFDCGRSKERRYDRVSGVQSYEIGWISKASASQRAGRAGRTGPGHCYRLFSSAVYERDFTEFADPELLRMPVEGVVLQLKAMNLQHVVNFPFPTPPERQSLVRAEKLLKYLSAISPDGQVTQIGSTMSIFPLSPRFARILLVGHLHDCLPYTIALVAGLSAAEVFVPENQAVPSLETHDEDEDEIGTKGIRTAADALAEDRLADARRSYNAVHKNFCFLDDRSDAIKLLQVVGEFAHDPTEGWCASHFVRFKVLREIQQLRRQIVELLRANIPAFKTLKHQDRLDPPSAKQVAALKQMVAAGFVDHVAIRADLAPQPPEQHRKPRRAIDVPYLPLIPIQSGGGSVAADVADRAVYIHPSSPLAHLSPQECPEYVVYAHLQRASAAAAGADEAKRPKTRMHALTDVTGAQLAVLAKGTPLVGYGKPIKEVSAGQEGGAAVREVWVVPYLRAEGGVGGLGWPLPARKVKQRKVLGKGWVVE